MMYLAPPPQKKPQSLFYPAKEIQAILSFLFGLPSI
jgi:hypothetical protein